MARPRKKGLDYFPKDTDTWDDFKIIELTAKYGPLGYCIYDVVRDEVYRNGYYLEIPLDTLALIVIRKIGNRWTNDKGYVLQVIQYCADIGLFDSSLLSQSVITSAGIQRRYDAVTVRNAADKTKYRLPEVGEAATAAPEKSVSASETEVFAAKTADNAAEMPPKKSKVKKSKVKEKEGGFAAPSLSEAEDYIKSRGYRFGAESFLAYYDSVGWKRGSSPITDWKRAADLWGQREKSASDRAPRSESPGEPHCTFNVHELENLGLLG